jgi:hypothetical protein
MGPPDVEAPLARLAAAAPEELDRDGCNARLRDLSKLRSWLGADELRTTRQLKALAAQGRAEPVEAALSNNGGHSASEARDTSDREEIADALPGFEDALADGAVTAGHLDALAAAVKLLAAHPELVEQFEAREPELLGFAVSDGVDGFRKRCRHLAKSLIAVSDADDELERQRARSSVKSYVDTKTGMWHLHAELDPVRGAIVDRHLQAVLARLQAQDQQTGDQPVPYMQLKVDALVTAISTTGDGMPSRPELVVHVDLDALRDNMVGLCETVDGVELPVATVRRLACDAGILPAVMGGDGLVKDMGRATRTATPAQRARLAAMHATCGHPGCRVPYSRCRIHHVTFWGEHLGPTDEDNLLPVCDKHHHLVHEGGGTLEMTPDRVATWRLPDGTTYWTGSTIDRHDQQPNHHQGHEKAA